LTGPTRSTTLDIVRHRSKLAGLVLLIAVSLVGSTSYALYLTSIGPAECCRSHCHRGKATADADAARCCTTHLSVVPSGLGPTAPDVHHVLVAAIDTTPSTLAGLDTGTSFTLPRAITGRASPPGSLLASHTSLLV
jgi:hypothetical protein